MTYNELITSFHEGDLTACISKGEIYLLENPTDQEALFLLAMAYHDLVFQEGHEAIYEAIQHYTIPLLRRILSIDPQHSKALYHILSYPLTNQQELRQSGSLKVLIQEDVKNEFIGYAKALIKLPEMETYGYDFLVQIYEGLDDTSNQLVVLDDALDFTTQKFHDVREIRDIHTSHFLLKKIYLLDRDPKADKNALISLIKQKIDLFVNSQESAFFDLAEIAFVQQDINLSIHIINKLLDCDEANSYVVENFIKWHKRLSLLHNQGYNDHSISYILLTLERNFHKELSCAETTYYTHALSLIAEFPETFAAYHFAGTYLVEQEAYADAMPYLKMALNRYPIASTWRRYVECMLYINHSIPAAISLNSSAIACYNEGCSLDDLYFEITVPELQSQLVEARLIIYQQAYGNFKAYFEENLGESNYAIDRHAWAMCCNNLAIVYAKLERYPEAAHMAREGINYSDFWELHATVIDAFVADKNYDGAHAALSNFFDNYEADDIPFLKHLQLLANRIETDYHLGNSMDLLSEAKILMLQIYDYGLANPDMDAYDFRDFEAAKTTTQSIYYLTIAEKNLPERIAIFLDLAKRYPQESNTAYMLMQLYFDNENYALSNQQAYRYLKLKPKGLLDPYDQAKTMHYILKTHILSQEYSAALRVYEENKLHSRDVLTDETYIVWLEQLILLFSKLDYKEDLLKQLQEYQAIYVHNNWEHDDALAKVMLQQADVWYAVGSKIDALKQLEELLKEDPANVDALQKKTLWHKAAKGNKVSIFQRLGKLFSKN